MQLAGGTQTHTRSTDNTCIRRDIDRASPSGTHTVNLHTLPLPCQTEPRTVQLYMRHATGTLMHLEHSWAPGCGWGVGELSRPLHRGGHGLDVPLIDLMLERRAGHRHVHWAHVGPGDDAPPDVHVRIDRRARPAVGGRCLAVGLALSAPR